MDSLSPAFAKEREWICLLGWVTQRTAMQLCPGCGTKNRESARFCDNCGVRMGTAASAVPAEPPAAALPDPVVAIGYTPKHLAEKVLKSRAALIGERKLVTVLFADIKGSTRLAEKVGAENWHGVLNQFFTVLTSAVHRFEGTVNQYTGDGIMALFGAPIAHEDHAQRACFAALEMQRELRRFAADLREQRAIELLVRIGLNTGDVIVGRIGDDLRMDYTAKGLTVNLAARMEQICTPGCIYASRYTAAQIGGDFILGDLGDREVEGASHPIRVYELEGERLTSARQHHAYGRPELPMVGRNAELDALQDALTTVRGGAGQIVAVRGDAGIGKSRLCREFAQICWSHGVPVHHAVGIPYSAALPMVPVRALLRSRLGLHDHAGADDVQRVVRQTFDSPNTNKSAVIPLIADFLGAGAGSAPGSLRSLLLERIARFLPKVARPQVLIVEDLQHADSATADFLLRLCEQVAATPTLLLINYRSDFSAPMLAPFLDRLIELKPLPAPDMVQLTHALLGGAPEMDAVASGLADRAQGNPFFVEEAVKALAETGHLSGETGNYALARTIEQWPIPQSVHALIDGRIDRLPDDQKALLQAASIMGRRFNADLLDAFAGGGFFKANLVALSGGGFIQPCEDPEYYEFGHPLTQEVAYQSQLETSRARLHSALAEVLEERTPLSSPAGEHAVSLAHHWAQASVWERAGAWNMQAARWFAPRDIEATLQQFRLAIQHLDRADYSFEVLRGRIAARAGLIRLAQFTAVGREEVDKNYHDAWKMAEEFQDIESGAELLFSYGAELLHRGEMDRAAQLTEEAVGHALSANPNELINRFRFSILMTHNAAGRLADGLRLASAAGDAWLRSPVTEDNFVSRGFYGALCTWQGRLADARSHIEASLAWAETQGRESIWQCADFVDWAGFSGDLDLAIVRGELAVRRAQNFGSPFFKTLALRALGLALCNKLEFGEARRLLEEARPLAAQGQGAYPLESGVLAVLGGAYLGLGETELAQRVADEALASAQRCQMRMGELQAWMVRLRVPGTPDGFVAHGLARMEELIGFTGAEVFRPWWLLARARHTAAGDQRAGLRAQANQLFTEMGARSPLRAA